MATLVLAHGAGAGSAHPWMQRVAAGLTARGVAVVTFDFPYIRAGKRVPDRQPVLEAAWREAWRDATARATGPFFAGGKSMGGRMASVVASRGATMKEAASKGAAMKEAASRGAAMNGGAIERRAATGEDPHGPHGFVPKPCGLVFFGYPLHPPNKPQQRRDAHLPAIDVPMLFVHGERDPFGTPDEMRALVSGLPRATLRMVAGGDHSLAAPKRADPGAARLEEALDAAAAWILAQSCD